MPKRVPIPAELTSAPFSLERARAAGLGKQRLLNTELTRPFAGVRSTHGGATNVLERCLEFAPRLRAGEYFSHETAAALWLAPLPRERQTTSSIHVSIAAPAGESRVKGVVGHKIKHARVRSMTRFGLPVSDPVTTFIHLATRLSLNDLVAVGDHLILVPRKAEQGEKRPYTTPDLIETRLERYEGRARRRAFEALALMRQGAESRPETLLRLLIRDAGLPEPQLNVDLFDERGTWMGRADMVYPEARLVVEYDGEQHRTNDEQYERDMNRHADFRRAGYDEVIVRKHGLFITPDLTAASIAHALAAHS